MSSQTNKQCVKCDSKNATVILSDKLYCSVCGLKEIKK
jgi:hypothetical protein